MTTIQSRIKLGDLNDEQALALEALLHIVDVSMKSIAIATFTDDIDIREASLTDAHDLLKQARSIIENFEALA